MIYLLPHNFLILRNKHIPYIMTEEERISDLESKILEQQGFITEIYKIAVNQQQMINDWAKQTHELQGQVNTLAEALTLLSKRMI